MDKLSANNKVNDWERTFDALPDLICILDTEHRVVRANQAMANRVGCTVDELIGKKCFQVVHGTAAPPMVCPHSLTINDGQEHAAEVTDERLGGTFLISVSPLQGSDGATTGSVHVARDITEQKQAENEARQAVNQRDQFLAMLSHELRNPLGAILNAAYVLKRSSSSQATFTDALAVIERQSQQMSFLLEDLLDVSRVMQGKIEARQDEVDLNDVLQEAIRTVTAEMERRRHTFVHDIDARSSLAVQGDGARLQQIAVNLLHNAAKYTPIGGQISVSLTREGDDCVLRVRDSGEGIPAEMQKRIFEPFFQADVSLHRQDGGMGLGLTLVHMLVEIHGGSISVHSNGVDQGSEFVVRLPAITTTDQPVLQAGCPADCHCSSKVLIVEDNPDARTMLQAFLQIEGHEVSVAEDGWTGLERLKEGGFDIALVDIGLPGLDGYEVARRFRQTATCNPPRLVALTGYGRPSDREAVMEAGFDEHLVKPYDPADLSRLLAKPR